MLTHSLLLLLSLYLLLPIQSQPIQCKDIKECFTCSNTPKCIWMNSLCGDDTLNQKNINFQWYELFPQYCNDDYSIVLMKKNCLNIEQDTLPFLAKVKLPRQGGSSIKIENTVYCRWKIDLNNGNPNTLSYFLEINDRNQRNFYLKTQFSDFTVENTEIFKSFNTKVKDVISFEFFFYTSEPLVSEDTFLFKVLLKYNVYNSKEFIIACSVLGSILLIIIVVGLSVVIYKKKHSTENSSNLERRAIGMREESDKLSQTKENNKEKLKRLLVGLSYDKFDYQYISVQKCSICYETFNKSTKATLLICTHIFHESCIQNWCNQCIMNPKCPNCNYEILNTSQQINQQYFNTETPISVTSIRVSNTTNSNNEATNRNDNERQLANQTHFHQESGIPIQTIGQNNMSNHN